MKKTDNINVNKFIKSVIAIGALVIILINSFIYINRKSGYFLDETATFNLANYNVGSIGKIIEVIKAGSNDPYIEEQKEILLPSAKWVGANDILNKYRASGKGMGSYFSTYILQAQDVHPPLYYFLIHTVSYAFPQLDLKWVGFSVNIVFLMAACIVIGRILFAVTGNYLVAVAGMLYYGLSFDFVNNVTYFRMYAVLTFWAVLLLYITLKWHKSDYEMDKATLIKMCIIEFCAMFTQYFAAFYIFPIFVLNLIFLIRRRKAVGRYIKYTVVTGAIYLMIWPFSIIHFFTSDDGGTFLQNLAGTLSLQRLKSILFFWFKNSLFAGSSVYMGVIFALVLVFVLSSLVYKKKRGELSLWFNSRPFETYLYLFVPACFHYVLVALFAPDIADRYQMQVMPAICMIIVIVLYKLCKLIDKKRIFTGVFLLSLPVVLLMYWSSRSTPYYLYDDELRKEFASNYMDYDAFLIEPEGVLFTCEIELNFTPPRLYETWEDGAVGRIAKELTGDGTVLYINKLCDIPAIEEELSAFDISYEKLEYSTQFYQIYYMK